MPADSYLGVKVRQLRLKDGLTQKELARRLGISPSYLNLIEHNQRPLTVPLLLQLARTFGVDLESFSGAEEAHLLAELGEILGDRLFGDERPTEAELQELVGRSPGFARAFQSLYRAYRGALEEANTMAEKVTDGEELLGLEPTRLPATEVSDLLQENRNHFPELEEAAEELVREARLDESDLFKGLAAYLREEHGVEVVITESERDPGAVRRFDPDERQLFLSEVLPPASATFQLAHQVGLLRLRGMMDTILGRSRLSTDESHRLGRIALANYFAGALTMPYERFYEAARSLRYDVELLEHRFLASFEQVCHRLTTLNHAGSEAVPLHLIRIDIAGNISKRFSASGIRFARYSGACPRWNVHAAFMAPGVIRTQVSRMPDGSTFFCIARTVRKAGGGHRVPQSRLAIGLGCAVQYARQIVYSDGVDLENLDAAVPVGVTCRLCERTDCRQRAFPPINHRQNVDENLRGLSFYFTPPSPR